MIEKMILLLILLSTLGCLSAENIQYNLDMPKKVKGKVPLIIECPGAGYHKDLSLFTDIRDEALKNNIACLRFNWKYYSEKRKPSDRYQEELQTIEEMIQVAKQNPAIDTEKIYLAGKSLGSVLAYQAMLIKEETKADEPKTHCGAGCEASQNQEATPQYAFRKDIKGLILLTPIFPDENSAVKLHPNLDKLNIDTYVIVGANDPENCDLKVLIAQLAKAPKAIELHVVGGDHGFNLEPWQEGVVSEKNNKNIQNVAQQTIFWIKNKLK